MREEREKGGNNGKWSWSSHLTRTREDRGGRKRRGDSDLKIIGKNGERERLEQAREPHPKCNVYREGKRGQRERSQLSPRKLGGEKKKGACVNVPAYIFVSTHVWLSFLYAIRKRDTAL